MEDYKAIKDEQEQKNQRCKNRIVKMKNYKGKKT